MIRGFELARARLREARLMLVLTPAAAGANDPLEALEAALPWLDLVQVRPKEFGSSLAPAGARETWAWARATLERCLPRGVPVIVDDRVDVALALREHGCAGVHLGQDDFPFDAARDLLGPGPLIGCSTHTLAQVVAAAVLPVDYLGFGPVHASATKGQARGLGAEACRIASQRALQPVFAIGGIARANAADLAEVGRAAVGADVLAASDPGRAARELRALLSDRA